ncbi:MAG: selenide, water dikinase SelD [Bacteroidales bacterium]
MSDQLRLTQFSPGAGCGCKISPAQLREILSFSEKASVPPSLLVGNEENDDAAVLDLGNGTALISTTDFFTPIVDDPYDFGRIAATNAISDVYAMAGTPLLAIAILGWPLEKLPASVANQVLEGARAVCRDAGIPLAGGHSIDISDPVFGLAVTGQVNLGNLRKNSTAEPGNSIYLTKPLGVGIITTAEKRGLAAEPHRMEAIRLMTRLNREGILLGKLDSVKALTDVTGFGLAGHLLEMCEGSRCNARISMSSLPLFPELDHYITLGTIPGGTNRNIKSYGHKIAKLDSRQKNILCDPQTSGGLLIAVDIGKETDFEGILKENGFEACRIGEFLPADDSGIRVHIAD